MREDPIKFLLVDVPADHLPELQKALAPLAEEVVAVSLTEALSQVQQAAMALIILDNQEPDRAGFSLARQIRAQPGGRQVPLLFLTPAEAGEDYFERGYAFGVVDFITRPYAAEVLRAKIALHSLPWRQEREGSAAAADMEAKIALLLVVERPSNLEAMEPALTGLADELVVCRSAPEALWHLVRRDFQVIMLDLTLPERSGFELVELVRRNRRFDATSLLLFSSVTRAAEDLARGAVGGACDFLFLPVHPVLLRAKIQALLAQARRSRLRPG